jgi:hypothetical protein
MFLRGMSKTTKNIRKNLSRMRFKPSTFRMWVRSRTANPTCSVNSILNLLTFHCYIRLLTKFTELNTSWEAANCAAIQELHRILRNPKIYYRLHKSPPLVPILNYINIVHTTSSCLRSILILSTHLRFCVPSGLFPSGFPPISYMHSSFSIRATCPDHLILLGLIILIILGE